MQVKLSYLSTSMNLIFVSLLFYVAAALVDNKFLYIVKDIVLVFVLFWALLRCYPINVWKVIGVFAFINTYALVLSHSDIDLIFYILSLREFLFYPVVGILLGYHLSEYNKFEKYFFRFILISLFLTVLYLIFFPYDSFGPTFRLTSFWDREHEPAIIAGVFLLWVSFSNYGRKYKILAMLVCISILLLSASRSVFLAIFIPIFLLQVKNMSIYKILLSMFFVAVFLSLYPYITLSGRGVDHNIDLRVAQYVLALTSLYDHNFLGLGSDQYGVVGSLSKEYCIHGQCTTTMDSTLLKYTVNYGVFFIIPFIVFLYKIFLYFFKIERNIEKKVFSILVFSLVIGATTGKLGAFPLNFIFYMIFGLFIYHFQFSYTKKERF
jgi:hypothetical protein